MSSEPNKNAFLENEEPIATRGVKLKNDRSKFAQAAEQKAQFEQRADEFVEKKLNRNELGFKLAREFMEAIKNKTLSFNKSPLQNDIEKELRDKLIRLVVETNNDPEEMNDGMGSAALIALLLKVVLVQRDQVNDLAYKVDQLEKASRVSK